MRTGPDDALLPLVAETNDLRRAAGQALWYLHRCLVYWRDRGRSFAAILTAWAPACGQAFGTLETRLRKLRPHARDERLRRYLSDVFGRLAGDLDRGDGMAVPFLRWLEARFPALTAIMREEARGARSPDRTFDLDLARDLRWALGEVSIASGASEIATRLRRTAADLLRSE